MYLDTKVFSAFFFWNFYKYKCESTGFSDSHIYLYYNIDLNLPLIFCADIVGANVNGMFSFEILFMKSDWFKKTYTETEMHASALLHWIINYAFAHFELI